MLCRRSASLIRRTRMSLDMATSSLRKFSACSAFLVTRSSFLILVSPSTRAPISSPNFWSISTARDVGVLDHVVQQRGRDRRVIEFQLGEDRRHFEGVGEVEIAGSALLVAVRLHGVDVRAIEQRLVRARVVSEHAFDKLVLAHHGTPRCPPRRTLALPVRSSPARAHGPRTWNARSVSAQSPNRRHWPRAPSASCFPCRAEAALR